MINTSVPQYFRAANRWAAPRPGARVARVGFFELLACGLVAAPARGSVIACRQAQMDIDAALSTRLIDLPHHRAGYPSSLEGSARMSWITSSASGDGNRPAGCRTGRRPAALCQSGPSSRRRSARPFRLVRFDLVPAIVCGSGSNPAARRCILRARCRSPPAVTILDRQQVSRELLRSSYHLLLNETSFHGASLLWPKE